MVNTTSYETAVIAEYTKALNFWFTAIKNDYDMLHNEAAGRLEVIQNILTAVGLKYPPLRERYALFGLKL